VSGLVVTRPNRDSNVGSNLASLAGAWWLASRLDRSLVVDWRGMSQLRDPALNYFAEFLSAPPTLFGTAILPAPAPDADAYEHAGAILEPGEAHLVARGEREAPQATIVLQTYHGLDRLHPGPEAERFRLLRSIYRQVGPAPRVAAEVDAWADEHLGGAVVVGVNVRTGNGQYFGRGQPYHGRVNVEIFEDERAFLRVLERAIRHCVRRLPRPLRDGFVTFYATDSEEMSALLARLPNAATRRTTFPPRGLGDLYAFPEGGYDDVTAVDDTVADMFLLARCDALVYNSSMFNQYARVVNAWFAGNHVHFESMYLRRRVADLASTARRAVRR
jgi:hypothetical protein